MSRKRKTYSADFKAKLVLELLKGDKTLNEIASKYEVLPKSLQDWKKQFLANASLVFDKSAVVKEYKEQITELEKQKEAYHRCVLTVGDGKVTIQMGIRVSNDKNISSRRARSILY